MIDNGYLQGGQVVLDRAKGAQDMRKAEADFTDDQQARQRAAALNAVNMLRSARDRGADIGSVFDRLAPVLPKLGVDPAEVAPLRQQITADPKVLDDLYAGLGGAADTSGRTLQIVTDDQGNMHRVTANGEVVPLNMRSGTFALGSGRLANAQENTGQRWEMGQPSFKGAVQQAEGYGGELGKVQGKTAAEDIPRSRTGKVAAEAALGVTQQTFNRQIAQIDDTLGKVNWASAGLGSMTKIIPGTPAANLQAKLTSVAANIVDQTIQELKKLSATGSTGYGALSNREGELLQSRLAAISEAQSPAQLKQELANLKDQLAQSWARVSAAYRADQSARGQFTEQSGGAEPTTPQMIPPGAIELH